MKFNKIAVLLLAVCLCLVLCACGDGNDSKEKAAAQTKIEATVEAMNNDTPAKTENQPVEQPAENVQTVEEVGGKSDFDGNKSTK